MPRQNYVNKAPKAATFFKEPKKKYLVLKVCRQLMDLIHSKFQKNLHTNKAYDT